MGSDRKLAAVIGWPVSHSLSPRLHNYWLKQYGIEGAYTAMEVKPEALEETMDMVVAKGFRGCNLTIPHKERIIPMLYAMDETAKSIGAVNTVIIKEGKLFGTNTDAYGFMENLKQHATFKKQKAVVLGAGGAARAVCKALADEGFNQVVITNRTLGKAETLADHFGSAFNAQPWDKRAELLQNTDLLVNTTSLGLEKNPPLEINLEHLPKETVVNDIIYRPFMTPLLKEAKARGNIIVDGLGMLIYQAIPGFEAWFGKKPEVTPELKQYLLDGL